MQVPPEEFDDHALKGAVRRCWAGECAPPELREKLQRIAAGAAQQLPNRSSRRITWMMWPMATAAVMVLSFALFYRAKPPVVPAETSAVFPVSLQTDLISRHDRCCKEADHQHLPVSKNDDVAIAAALRSRLNRPALVARPTDPGWTFRGAAICPVGSTPAGHLVFVKGNNALSIFSLPESLVPHAIDGQTFAVTTDQHSVVGFVKDGALFCLVGSGPPGTLDVNQLQQMQKYMQSSVTAVSSPQHGGIELAELLHPITP